VNRPSQGYRQIVHPEGLPVALAAVAPDGDGTESCETGLVGINCGEFTIIVQQLKAGLGIEVEGPLVPTGRGAFYPEPEQLVKPVFPVTSRGGVTFRATEVVGVKDTHGEQGAIFLKQSPARADPMGFGILGPGALVEDP